MGHGVHVLGSLAFETSEAAMRGVAGAGDAVSWIPDGETGDRAKWMSQHQKRFDAVPGLSVVDPRAGDHSTMVSDRRFLGVAPGVVAEDVTIPALGYADWALESFEVFSRLKRDGVVAAPARFQVSIPTPLGILSSFVAADHRGRLEGAVERAVLDDVRAIVAAIPHDELAIQWDVAIEFLMLEGLAPTHFADAPLEGVIDRLVRYGEAVPDDVALAYHLCYGAPYDVHFAEPSDAQLMVQVTNGIHDRIGRRVDRVHLPVPIYRDDEPYFASLRDLRAPETALYLGLVHHEDGVEGARRRIAAAKRAREEFGVATECGTGRTIAEPLALLRLQAEAARIAAEPVDETIVVPAKPRAAPVADPAEVDARLRRFAEQIPCVVCGADIGAACADESSRLLARPHMDRYNAALLRHVGGDGAERASVNASTADWDSR